MKHNDYIARVNELVSTFGKLPSFASETEVRANIEKLLYPHGVGIDPQMPAAAVSSMLSPVAGLDDAYSSLRRVLDAAYDQAATGKGAERHANARSFESQPMQSISDLLGDNHGLLFQAVKKIQESTRLPHYRRRERELLGAINYIAGAIIFDMNHSTPEESDAED